MSHQWHHDNIVALIATREELLAVKVSNGVLDLERTELAYT